MSSNFVVVFKLFLLGYAWIQQGCFGETISTGGEPNVKNLTANISISRNISLYAADINLLLSVYQRPLNTTSKDTLKVLKGSISVNSTNRCIAFGFSFDLGGQLQIKDNQAVGNGGCDALWGNECSVGILAALKQFSGNINNTACGVATGNIAVSPPKGCPDAFKGRSLIVNTAILNNGSFNLPNSSPTDISKTWVYYQSDPSSDGDYNNLTKYSVLTYFVGRPYTGGQIDAAIACFPLANKGQFSRA